MIITNFALLKMLSLTSVNFHPSTQETVAKIASYITGVIISGMIGRSWRVNGVSCVFGFAVGSVALVSRS